MFNCSSNAVPDSPCLPPCGGALPRHGTCAGPLAGGYIRPDRHGDNPNQPRPKIPPKIKDPGAHVRAQFNEVHGCDPTGYGKPGCEQKAEPSSLPELVTRPVPDRTWAEWYSGLGSRCSAAIEDVTFHIPGGRFERAARAGKPTPPPEPGLGNILMLNSHGQQEDFEPIKGFIDTAAGKQKVQFIYTSEKPGEKIYPFLRNLAIEANGVLLVNGQGKHEGRRKSAGLIAEHCERNGIPYQRLPVAVNLANVQYLPSKDLLVIASSSAFYFSKAEREMLQAAFGNPKHLIHVELDQLLSNQFGGKSCYDLDMGLHLTRNADGQPVALIYPDCIRAHPDLAASGRRDFLLALHELGVKLVELSEYDQQSLAANSVSWGLPPGQILMPSRHVSGKLKSDLEAAGMRPRFPRGHQILGGKQADNMLFGLHCMTLHLPQAANSNGASGELPTNPRAQT